MIAVEANLRAESSGLRLNVTGNGSLITCRLDGRPVNVLKALRRAPGLLPALRTALPHLGRAGLRLEVIVGNIRVARAGFGVEQNVPARLLKLPGLHLGF